MNIGTMIGMYEELESEILEAFKFEPQWHRSPLSDETDMFWRIRGHSIEWAPESELLGTGEHFEAEIIGEIRRADGYALVDVDTNCDGNRFLFVLSEAKEQPAAEED